MYSEVFLTQFWPICWMVHFIFEGFISSWYTYEIKIHIKCLLPQVWNKIIAHLTAYQSKKVGHWAKTKSITKNQKNLCKVEVQMGLLGLREGFS